MTDAHWGHSVSLTIHTSRFSILEGYRLNKKMQAEVPFSYLMPPIILEVGKKQQIGRKLKENTFVRGDYSLY